jgi:mRNA interferase HigB
VPTVGQRMRVISRRTLREFWELHPPAKEPLTVWFRLMQVATYPDFNVLRRTFRAADYVAPHTVFNVGGNKYRVIVVIHCNRQRAYVREVLTHAEYNRWKSR